VVDTIGPAVMNDEMEDDQPAAPPAKTAAKAARRSPASGAVVLPVRSWWERHNPLPHLSLRDKAIRKLALRIKVEPVVKSNVVVITYRDYSPELAQAVVDKLMAFYIEEHVRLNRTPGTYDFLVKQTGQLQSRLAGLEKRLCDLKNEAGVVSVESRAQNVQDQIGQIESETLEVGVDTTASKAQIAALHKLMATLPETEITAEITAEDKAVATMRDVVHELEIKEQDLLASTTKEYFKVPQLQKRLSAAHAALASQNPTRIEITKGPGRRREETHLMLLRQEPLLVASEAKTERLQANLTALHAQLAQLNQKHLEITQVQRDIELCDKNYRKYVANLEQARIDQALESQSLASVNIAEPATYEPKAVWPKATINLAGGLFVGLFGGAGLAFLSEFRRRSAAAC
jgi:polysaccharide biosynthesis protein PslE